MTVSDAQLMSEIHLHPNVRQRVTALIMQKRWDSGSSNPGAPIDIENVMWAVATNATIITKAREALAAAPEGDEADVHKALLGGVDDADLDEVVTQVAAPRLGNGV